MKYNTLTKRVWTLNCWKYVLLCGADPGFLLQGNHFDQYEEGHLEIEQASLDKPIESVRPPPTSSVPPEFGRVGWSLM